MPSGEAGLAQRRRARWRLALFPRARRGWPKGVGRDGGQPFVLGRGGAGPKASGEFVIRARNAAAPMSVQKFLTFDGYLFHLLGYPGIRSPTVAPEPLGDSSRTAWRVFLILSKLICRRVRASAPDGCSPRAPGDSSRVAQGVVSAPSWVRLKDLVFYQLDVFSSGSWRPVRWELIRG